MSTSNQITNPPTELEIEHALDVISRAAKARKTSGQDRPRDRAFHRYWEQKRILAAECDETAQSLYRISRTRCQTTAKNFSANTAYY